MSLTRVHENSPISASGIKDYDGCPRYFVFKKVEELETPGGEAAEHGKRIHAENEGWIRFGRLPEHAHALKLLALFADNPFAPVPGGCTEAEHEFHLRISGVYWRGFMDWRRVRDAGQIIVGDWKTTTDIAKYSLRADRGILVTAEGVPDVQSTLYAAKEFVGGAEEVYANWAYVQTKGELRSKLVDARFERQHVEDIYGGKLHPAALEIKQLYRIRPKANDVPYKTTYCFAYHKPCPFTSRCVKPQGMFAHQPLDLVSPEGANAMTAFLDSIRGSFPTPEEDTPPPVPSDDAPPPPPEDDAPPAVPADEDAPPPPPEDDDHAAEKLVEEYYAAQGKVMPREIATVEAGSVNPPEAEGIVAAESPEDARARFDCAPPKAEKPKKPKKPTKKELAALAAAEAATPQVELVEVSGEMQAAFASALNAEIEGTARAVAQGFADQGVEVSIDTRSGDITVLSDAQAAAAISASPFHSGLEAAPPEGRSEGFVNSGIPDSDEMRRIIREELASFFSSLTIFSNH